MYESGGETDRAIECWLKASTLDPQDLRSRKSLVSTYESQGDLADAIPILEQLCELEPKSPHHPMNLGVLFVRLKRVDDAERVFRHLRQVAPEQPEGYVALIQMFIRQERKLDEAKALAAQVVGVEPTAFHYYLLGVACQKQEDYAGALTAFQRATELDPGDPRYQDALAQLKGNN